MLQARLCFIYLLLPTLHLPLEGSADQIVRNPFSALVVEPQEQSLEDQIVATAILHDENDRMVTFIKEGANRGALRSIQEKTPST